MEEMCVNYVHYYPRTQLELCKSHVDPGYLQKYFSLINRYRLEHFSLTSSMIIALESNFYVHFLQEAFLSRIS